MGQTQILVNKASSVMGNCAEVSLVAREVFVECDVGRLKCSFVFVVFIKVCTTGYIGAQFYAVLRDLLRGAIFFHVVNCAVAWSVCV